MKPQISQDDTSGPDPVQPDPDQLIKPAKVRAMCGGVSDMSIWRWLKEPALHFPKPVYIGRHRYWRETEVRAWLAERQGSERVAAE